MLTRDADLFAALRDDVFPAMLAAAGDVPQREVLAAFLRLVTVRVGAMRGLEGPAVTVEPRLRGAQEAGAARLAGLDFSAADLHLAGDLYAALRGGRHAAGSYYTPPALTDLLARRALDPLLGGLATSPSVLDPACGAGHFLVAAAEVIAEGLGEATPGLPARDARRLALGALHGVDSDLQAVELARAALWLWAGLPELHPDDLTGTIRCGDALLDDDLFAAGTRFDAVLGNPPFASVFTRAAGDGDGGRRAALQTRYATAQGSFDLSVPFVERAVSLCRPGGRIGLIVPNKLLAADYARALREWLGERARVEAVIDAAHAGAFRADVYPVALVMARERPADDAPLTVLRVEGAAEAPEPVRRGDQTDLRGAPGAVWSAALDPAWGLLRRCFEGSRPLGEAAELSAGLAVGEAYALRERVVDSPLGQIPAEGFMLLTSGLIRRHGSLWGCKPARYLKRTYRRPIVMCHALPERRRRQAASPKLIVSGLSRRPQAVLDGGLTQASVATTIIYDAAWPLGALAAVLNSELMARLYRALFGGLALSGGYLRVGQRELAHLPLPALPADDPRVARLDGLGRQIARADVVAAGDLDEQIDALVYALYGIDPAELPAGS